MIEKYIITREIYCDRTWFISQVNDGSYQYDIRTDAYIKQVEEAI